ncbi:MAG TPA: hypothetical protein VFB62_19185 [Polyangiaceae bacterium]|nr:hypothetical protein [Polyangiaceae bacterium]
MKAPYLCLIVASLFVACEREEEPPPQYPPQAYPQPYPQPYPQQQPYPQPYPQPAATTPVPAPATPTTAGTATSIPGVMKRDDGTCFITPPSLDAKTPAQPVTVPCPP